MLGKDKNGNGVPDWQENMGNLIDKATDLVGEVKSPIEFDVQTHNAVDITPEAKRTIFGAVGLLLLGVLFLITKK